MRPTLLRTIRSLKLAARKLCSNNSDLSYSQALDKMAMEQGFISWSLLISHEKLSQVKTMHELSEKLFSNTCSLLAAKPNVGKMSLAINFSLQAAKTNKQVIYLSLNASNKSMQEKFAAANSAIAHKQFSTCESDLKPEEKTNIQNGLNELSHLPIRFYEKGLSLEFILSILNDHANHNCFIIIDYVQLLQCEAIEKAIFQLKNIARLNNISLLLISQLNDECANSHTKITLDALSGGKMITRHCDWVMSMHRDSVHNTEAKLHVLKSKTSSYKHFDIHFDPLTGICSW